jgi:hypothetical protein
VTTTLIDTTYTDSKYRPYKTQNTVCCTQLANHINTSFNNLRHCPGEVCDGWREEDDASEDGYDEPSWRWTDIDFGKIGDDNIKNPAVAINHGRVGVSGTRTSGSS